MPRDVVKYHNDMNKVNLGVFSTKELDLFFSICFKLKEQGTNEIKISFDGLVSVFLSLSTKFTTFSIK
ncbi:RepB family plasmid replication initiator protein [uncultured Cetobacterium sp.]|uniref:RepB family plasmid replication initiator protein n=1 Tax=uncultured Cetobacterium sp. TaxID=527638 RepID=UPI00344F0BF6